jgi:hypothetical protein
MSEVGYHVPAYDDQERIANRTVVLCHADQKY